jgi:hypothetical protein
MVWNNSTSLSTCITFVATSSTYFCVFVYVVRFLNPSSKDPNSCIILLPNPNWNGYPFVDHGILVGTYSSSGLSTAKAGCVSILSICSSLAYKPPCVYYCCCKCYGLSLLSIQFSYMSPFVEGCYSTSGNLISCSLLTFCFCSLICFFCGDDIYGISTLLLLAYTNVGTIDGATLLFIIFWALTSCSHVLFQSLILRLHLPKLCSSSWEHSLEIMLQFLFSSSMLPTSRLRFFWP